MNRILLLGLVTLAAFAVISHADLCVPDQWQGFVHEKTEYPIKFTNLYHNTIAHMFSDATNLKVAEFVNYTTDQVQYEGFRLFLYNKTGPGYTAYNLDLKTSDCKKVVDTSAKFSKYCLPAGAKNLGSSHLGVVGKGGINVTDYGFVVHPEDTPAVMTVTQVGSNFIPIHESYFNGNDNTFTDNIYFNFTPGIKDPSIFDIPKPCQKEIVDITAQTPLTKSLLRSLIPKV